MGAKRGKEVVKLKKFSVKYSPTLCYINEK